MSDWLVVALGVVGGLMLSIGLPALGGYLMDWEFEYWDDDSSDRRK